MAQPPLEKIDPYTYANGYKIIRLTDERTRVMDLWLGVQYSPLVRECNLLLRVTSASTLFSTDGMQNCGTKYSFKKRINNIVSTQHSD